MSVHIAEIEWLADGDFLSGQYHRRHLWRFDGGTEIMASASPDVVAMPYSDPAGVDPEEALVASVSSCHMLWFLDLARRQGLAIESYSDRAEGHMGRIAPGRMAITRITLRPRIGFSGEDPAREEIQAIHGEAHERCFIANSLRTEISIES